MEDILVLITSPVFWIGTVVAGLILSIVANFVTDSLRAFAGRYSAAQKFRNQQRDAEIDQDAKTYSSSTQRLVVLNGMLNTMYWKFTMRLLVVLVIMIYIVIVAVIVTTSSTAYQRDVVDRLLALSISGSGTDAGALVFDMVTYFPSNIYGFLKVSTITVGIGSVFLMISVYRILRRIGYLHAVQDRVHVLMAEQASE